MYQYDLSRADSYLSDMLVKKQPSGSSTRTHMYISFVEKGEGIYPVPAMMSCLGAGHMTGYRVPVLFTSWVRCVPP